MTEKLNITDSAAQINALLKDIIEHTKATAKTTTTEQLNETLDSIDGVLENKNIGLAVRSAVESAYNYEIVSDRLPASFHAKVDTLINKELQGKSFIRSDIPLSVPGNKDIQAKFLKEGLIKLLYMPQSIVNRNERYILPDNNTTHVLNANEAAVIEKIGKEIMPDFIPAHIESDFKTTVIETITAAEAKFAIPESNRNSLISGAISNMVSALDIKRVPDFKNNNNQEPLKDAVLPTIDQAPQAVNFALTEMVYKSYVPIKAEVEINKAISNIVSEKGLQLSTETVAQMKTHAINETKKQIEPPPRNAHSVKFDFDAYSKSFANCAVAEFNKAIDKVAQQQQTISKPESEKYTSLKNIDVTESGIKAAQGINAGIREGEGNALPFDPGYAEQNKQPRKFDSKALDEVLKIEQGMKNAAVNTNDKPAPDRGR